MPFVNPIAAGDGTIVLDQFKSSNFSDITHQGWAIYKNGDATFYGMITGNSLRLGPMNIGVTPYLNLIKTVAVWGEGSGGAEDALSVNYVTTAVATDPGFGGITLPLSNQFSASGQARIKFTVDVDIQPNGAIPSGVFIGEIYKSGVALTGQMIVLITDATTRLTISRTWTSTVTYVAGAPQSTFDFQVRSTAGPNFYRLSQPHTHVITELTPILENFMEA